MNMYVQKQAYEKIFIWNVILYRCGSWTLHKKRHRCRDLDLEQGHNDRLNPMEVDEVSESKKLSRFQRRE